MAVLVVAFILAGVAVLPLLFIFGPIVVGIFGGIF